MLLWLDPIPVVLHGDAREYLERGDAASFLGTADNIRGLSLVSANLEILRERGIYESALLHARSARHRVVAGYSVSFTRTNNHSWPNRELKKLFEIADRSRLRRAGDPQEKINPLLPRKRHGQ
jgi:hypothetical protein